MTQYNDTANCVKDTVDRPLPTVSLTQLERCAEGREVPKTMQMCYI